MTTAQTQSPRRGATPSPRSALAAATPHAVIFGAPPTFLVMPKQLSFWGNFSDGDCVSAEEAFAKSCNNPEIFISQDEVMAWATNHGILQGANCHEVLQWMQNGGFGQEGFQYDDGPYNSVDWTDSATLRSAISQGPVKIGVAGDQLNTTWWKAGSSGNGGVSGWFATGYHKDTVYDHCVSLCGYGSIAWLAEQLNVKVPSGINGTDQGYALFTWDSIGIIDVPSLLAITNEAWVRKPTTVSVPPPIEFAGVMVPDAGQAWWWYYGITGEQVGQFLTQNKAMLTDIDAYIDVDNTVKFVVTMEPVTEAWWWYWGQTAEQVGQLLTKNKAAIRRISPYIDTDKTLKFAVIMGEAKSAWWWYWGQSGAEVGELLTKNKAALTDIRAYIDTDNTLKFAVIMGEANSSWWWYWGQSGAEVGELLTKNKAALTDISSYIDPSDHSLKFAVIMAQTKQPYWWYWGQSAQTMGQLLNQNKARLTSVSAHAVK